MAKKSNNVWKVDIRPNGHTGRRIRRTFPTHQEAKAFENWITSTEGRKSWDSDKRDSRKLADLANLWFELHGHTLTTGKQRLGILHSVINDLGNPPAHKIDPAEFLRYRSKRLESGTSEDYLNKLLVYLNGIFNVLYRANQWSGKSPYDNLQNLKFDERELHFLSSEEAKRLFSELKESRNPDVLIVARICLGIGCRWGEAQNLKRHQVANGMIHLSKTKTGKNRSIPISKSLESEILLGRQNRTRLFANGWKAFQHAVERANIDLPKGQMTHVLRHTYASHFIMKGGRLETLSKILGHSTIQMTMRYAHLAPDYLRDATIYNLLEEV